MSPKQFAAWQKTPYGRYSTNLKKHPFLLFGLPFMATIFVGSIYLAEFTSIRYEQYDEKVTMVCILFSFQFFQLWVANRKLLSWTNMDFFSLLQMSEEEALSVDRGKRKVDMKDEYYVSWI